MTSSTSTETRKLDPAILDPDYRPRSRKVILRIEERGRGELRILLSAALRPDNPAENAALEFGDTIDIEYAVSIDLQVAREELRRSLSNFYDSDVGRALCSSPLMPVDRNTVKLAMLPVAKLGQSLFHRLFEMRQINDHNRDDSATLRAAVHSVLSRTQIITIRGPDPLFPWAFLMGEQSFDQTRLSTWQMESFWGFHHEIEQKLSGMATKLRMAAPPQILAAICNSTDAGRHKTGGGIFAEQGWISTVAELRKSLADFGADGLYVYGHAGPNKIQLNMEDLSVQVLTLQPGENVKLHKNPVVLFLNGCNTAAPGQWNDECLPGYLCRRSDGRLCCITTVDRVPEEFAVRYGQEFWLRFLDYPLPIGDALRRARQALLSEFNNPLGLMYTFFGLVDTRLAVAH